MWTKSKEKRGVGRLHASNFGAGYVKIEEYHLMRTGLRGRKRWFFLCGAVFLMLIALGNLLVYKSSNIYYYRLCLYSSIASFWLC